MCPRWFQLVHRYPNTRGPTIPFLLGALRMPPGRVADEEASKAELRALLVAMRDEMPDGYRAGISSCGVIGQLIVTVNVELSAGATIPSLANPSRGLDIEPTYGLPNPDLDSVASELWRRIREPVLAGRFSYRQGEWYPFNDQELGRIRECLVRDGRLDAT